MSESQQAWIAIAKAPSELSYGVHDGYDDEPGSHYEYDSLVGNHKNIKAGDLLFVRGSRHLLGFGQVETITTTHGAKELRKCPTCGGRPESRKTKMPEWRCMKCASEFETDELDSVSKEITVYRASYANTWQDANQPLDIDELLSFQANNDTQSAIRKLNFSKVPALITRALGLLLPNNGVFAGGLVKIEGGHTITVSRRRRGQQEFRLALLAANGPSCFVSGLNPEFVLEAAHIRPFAKFESHSLSGGLLLRRDLHALFDRSMLRIDPVKWQVEVSPAIKAFPYYQSFHQQKVVPPASNPPNTELLAEHYSASASNF